MLKIGITGGIGSGKTTVCKLFEKLGVPVYYADDWAKWLMNNHESLKSQLIFNFGDKIYVDGILDRKLLASIVFTNQSKLNQLNQLVHPVVFDHLLNWQHEQEGKNVPFTLKEAALLYESGSYKKLDKIIVVTAPLELRIKRVMQRDQTDEKSIQDRINKQMSQEEKVSRADYVIENIQWETLNIQVSDIYEKLIYLSKR